MALSTTTIQPTAKPAAEKTVDNGTAASLLSLLVLSVFAAQKSKKAMRKLKRHFMWTAFKLKMKSMFSKKADVSDRDLLILLLAVLGLVLLFLLIGVYASLILLLILIILYLLGIIKI
jgi:hypothetical protein